MKISNSSDRLKELMQIKGINQADICKQTGLTKSVISMYVNGQRDPRQDKLGLIAETYGLDPAWLMGYDVPMKNMYQRTLEELEQKKRNEKNYQTFADLYSKLTEEQQLIICNLMKSMLPTKRGTEVDK